MIVSVTDLVNVESEGNIQHHAMLSSLLVHTIDNYKSEASFSLLCYTVLQLRPGDNLNVLYVFVGKASCGI